MTSTKRSRSSRKSHLKCFYHIALLMSILLTEVSGQFFTKSSSKSIPRMGRRSIQETNDGSSSSRSESDHGSSLFDALIDEYGPNLINKLRDPKLKLINLLPDSSETKFDNQPISPASQNYLANEQSLISDQSLDNPFGRNERSPLASGKGNSNYRDSSLAMRAFNTDRYIQHLASGQPLTSFESLLASSRDRSRSSDSVGGMRQVQNYSYD